MLRSLHIRNLALVVDLEVEFGRGLNTVTGETGAGKSLILGAVQLLIGGRGSPSLIRRGESQCEVAGVIELSALRPAVRAAIDALLAENGIEADDSGSLLLRRVVAQSGSRAFVNGSSVTLGFLKDLGSFLVDIHGPHEHQSLLRSRCQLELLDAYGDLTGDVAGCAGAHAALVQARRALDEARADTPGPDELSFLRFQLDEIDRAELSPGEEDDLRERHRVASHGKRLLELATQIRLGLTESDLCLMDQFGVFLRLFNEMAQLDPDGAGSFAERIEQAAEQIQELGVDLADYAEALELDEESFRAMEDRLDLLQRLRHKHGGSIEDVLTKADDIRGRLDALDHRQETIERLEHALARAAEDLNTRCAALHNRRVETAAELSAAIETKLRRLGFQQAVFQVDVTGAEPGPTGADRVEFCIAPNVGEPLLPLRQIASSGEMARIMLAVKTVLTQADSVPVLIFDEVDANIGGRVAVIVAEELAAIASNHQVMSITHLPQIAAAGDNHFLVTKTVQDGRTITSMTLLEERSREREIARMMGAPDHSAAAATHARELLGKATPGT